MMTADASNRARSAWLSPGGESRCTMVQWSVGCRSERAVMHAAAARLEGLCEPSTRNRVVRGLGSHGIERIEAHLLGQAFTPHRHDTYAIGITLSGVQTFRYRGERWYCLPGQCHILHPDET